ncbi:glycosyltransferase family 39 protein [Candidatus Bathyarchaeota archaeon A05DMB-2]|nr:glycosyltransferase family 39 protein [Candidatus Bathyarchaeota archaeon A05DMB-2]
MVRLNRDTFEALKNLLGRHLPLFGVLLGSALLFVSMGPYSNWDSQIEYTAASAIIKWGFPYTTFGNMINVQPFGFYIDAAFFKVFGVYYTTGVNVITLFAVGCVFLVYKIGEVMYGPRTGLFAAAFFGLAPWQVIMSRVFLADAQYLFFSLLYLLVGIWAIRRKSLKLVAAAGFLFGLALLTKTYAVFMLIPLALVYTYHRPRSWKRFSAEIGLFVLLAFLVQYLWYDPISGRGLLSLTGHDDFVLLLPEGFTPSPFFSVSFLAEILGAFFLASCVLSVMLSFLQREASKKVVFFDVVSVVTIVSIVGLSVFLVVGNHMLVPYANSIKYNYLALPFFCFLAASLAKKCSSIIAGRSSGKYGVLVASVALVGLFLLLVSMIANPMMVNLLFNMDWIMFKAEGGFTYSFVTLTPFLKRSYLWLFQVSAFILVYVSLLWANRDKLYSFSESL